MSGLLLILAIMPVVVICTYIYLKDRNKEPWPLLVGLFILGILSCFLVLLLSDIVFKIFPFMEKDTSFMTFFEVMAYAFVGVALIEEFCKWLMTFVLGYRSKSYDEVYDGIVYAVYVSLGFACLENILYVFANQSIVVGISRSILAVPGHACDAVFMGYYLSLAKIYASQGNKKLESKNLVLSVLVPTILHGIYDFCLFADVDILLLVFLVFVITIYIFSIKKIKLLAAQCKNTPAPQPQVQQQYSYPPLPQHQQLATLTAGGYANSGYVNPQTYQNNGYINHQAYQTNGYINPQAYQNSGYINTNQQQTSYCAMCGTPTQNGVCPKCGSRQN